MRYILSCLSCLASLVAAFPAAGAPKPDLPLFTAFKTFCVDTGAKPDAVSAAVVEAGGTRHNPPGGSTENSTLPSTPFPMALAMWDVTVDGHRMMVSTGTAFPSRDARFAGRANIDFDSCTINSWGNEDASVAVIGNWAGVPPTIKPEATVTYSLAQYEFQMVGSIHRPVAGQADRLSANTEGRDWGLVLQGSARGASVMLTHILPKPPAH